MYPSITELRRGDLTGVDGKSELNSSKTYFRLSKTEVLSCRISMILISEHMTLDNELSSILLLESMIAESALSNLLQ